jgi:hypothetical protein
MITPKTKVTATLTANGLSLIVNGDPATINNSHVNYERIITALREQRWDDIPDLLNVAQAIVKFTEGLVSVSNGEIHYNGAVLHNSLTSRMLEMITLGLDIRPMAKFLNRLMKNPSHRSVTQLHRFMEACDLPITEDGKLLVYRSVRSDFLDRHTGKTTFSKPADIMTREERQSLPRVVNGVTTTIGLSGRTLVYMDRNMVNDNPDETCSNGLHVCSQGYGQFSDILLLCAVDPADVVSVPKDYNAAKMRVSGYEVLKVVQKMETFKEKPVYNDDQVDWAALGYSDDDEDDSWDDDSWEDFGF